MNERRLFFKKVANKSAEAVIKEMSQRANARAAHWIRPPFALDEVEFLLACTRCDACRQACPHEIIFKLPARVGVTAAGTPALDLNRKACRICDDWPCVAACEPGALAIGVVKDNEEDEPDALQRPSLPVLALCRIDSSLCLPYSGPECGACKGSCPVPGALVWDDNERPGIVEELCIGCAACREACVMEPRAITVQSLYAADK